MFYENGSLLGSDTRAPYVFNWNNATVGSHDIYVIAVDNTRLKTKSAVHRIYVSQDTAGSSSSTGTGTGVSTGAGTLVVYPADQAIKNRFQSDRFAVRLTQNGATQSSFVYKSTNNPKPGLVRLARLHAGGESLDHVLVRRFGRCRSQSPRWQGRQDLHRAPAVTEDTDQRPGQYLQLHARSAREGFRRDRRYQDDQCKLQLHRQGDQADRPTPPFIFADPLETNVPKAGSPGVLDFGPGIHTIGKQYPLANNTQVYIAGGACVIGTFKSAQSSPQNISIRGRGILSGIDLTESAAEQTQWGNHAVDFSYGTKGSNLLIEGITITDPLRSCIESYNPIQIRDVKLLSWNHRNDGITAGKNSLIENSFIKVEDDNIKLYYSNQTVRRNVVWQQTSGAVFKLAWKLSGVAQGSRISDIDVIHSDVDDDYSTTENDRPDMHSTSAIFSAMGFQRNAAFENATFTNIRIEEENLLRLMSLRMVSTHKAPTGTNVWGDPNPTAGKLIDGLTFENVQMAGEPYKQSTLYGNAGGAISNLKFVNLSVGGQVVTSGGALGSRNDGSGLATAGKVSAVTFSR